MPGGLAVAVVSSVRNPTTLTWQQGRNVDYYLDQSGGLSKESDKDEIYVVKPDGSTVASFVRVRDVEPGAWWWCRRAPRPRSAPAA